MYYSRVSAGKCINGFSSYLAYRSRYEARIARRSTATARALVDYSDDESDDDGYVEDEAMYPNEDMTERERARYEHSNDDSILGITVIARDFVESGSTGM